MQQAIISRPSGATMPPPPVRKRKEEIVTVHEPVMSVPPRRRGGPVHISTLLNPVLEICGHPDRDRLLAEFFSEY